MTTTSSEKFWTIPNLLSLYRIAVFPFILWLIIYQNESLFAVFITISMVTDILDGLIARVFNMKTSVGAKLDSWADTGTYVLAFLAIYVFKWEQIKWHAVILIVFFIAWMFTYVLVFIKFRGLAGLHTYLFKITGYVQGAFIVVLFVGGFYAWLYYTAICTGILACIEEAIILFVLKRPQSNVKGLYWVLKDRRAGEHLS